jgi:hypothetical protein
MVVIVGIEPHSFHLGFPFGLLLLFGLATSCWQLAFTACDDFRRAQIIRTLLSFKRLDLFHHGCLACFFFLFELPHAGLVLRIVLRVLLLEVGTALRHLGIQCTQGLRMLRHAIGFEFSELSVTLLTGRIRLLLGCGLVHGIDGLGVHFFRALRRWGGGGWCLRRRGRRLRWRGRGG